MRYKGIGAPYERRQIIVVLVRFVLASYKGIGAPYERRLEELDQRDVHQLDRALQGHRRALRAPTQVPAGAQRRPPRYKGIGAPYERRLKTDRPAH